MLRGAFVSVKSEVIRIAAMSPFVNVDLDRFRSRRRRIAKPVSAAASVPAALGASWRRTTVVVSKASNAVAGNGGNAGHGDVESSRSIVEKVTKVQEENDNNNDDNVDVEDAARDWSHHFGERHPLRVIFVGHNPSTKSWAERAPYAHPTNKFWRLLKESSIIPPELCIPSSYMRLSSLFGVGFIDLFVTCGSDASKIGNDVIKRKDKNPERDECRMEFIHRLNKATGNKGPVILACVSKVVAKKLLQGWKGDFGFVGYGPQWKLTGCDETEVWVLPSTSGRAVLSWEDRIAPFHQLSKRLANEPPW